MINCTTFYMICGFKINRSENFRDKSGIPIIHSNDFIHPFSLIHVQKAQKELVVPETFDLAFAQAF